MGLRLIYIFVGLKLISEYSILFCANVECYVNCQQQVRGERNSFLSNYSRYSNSKYFYPWIRVKGEKEKGTKKNERKQLNIDLVI